MKKTRKTPTGYETSIVGGILYFEDARQCDIDAPQMEEIVGDGYCNSIRVVSLNKSWFTTVYHGSGAKINEDINVQMTLRREKRAQRWYWYAYRRVLGKLHKRFVGGDENLTNIRLLEIAQKMPSL